MNCGYCADYRTARFLIQNPPISICSGGGLVRMDCDSRCQQLSMRDLSQKLTEIPNLVLITVTISIVAIVIQWGYC